VYAAATTTLAVMAIGLGRPHAGLVFLIFCSLSAVIMFIIGIGLQKWVTLRMGINHQ
jgi:hypothetical protein